MRRLRKADGGELDWSKLNQPTGSLTAHNPTPTEAIGNAAKDAMVGLGAQPYVANHVVGGVGNILGLTPLGIAGSAADTVAAQARGDKLGAIEGMAGMVPGVRAMPHVQAAQAVSRQMQKLTAAREMFGDLAEHIGMLHNKVNDIADSHVAPEMLDIIDHLRSVKDHETDLHGITDTAKELMRAKVPKEIISDLPEDLAPHQRDDIAAIEQRLRRLYGMLPDRAAEVRKAGVMAEREMRRFNNALPEDMDTMDWGDSIVEPHHMLSDTKQRIGRHLPDAERASGGRVGYAEGGAPTFDPDEFNTFKTAVPARPSGFDPAEFAASRQQHAAPDEHGLSERQKLSPVGKALSPVTGYWDTYQKMNKEAQHQMGEGFHQMTNPDSLIDPQAHGLWDIGAGAVNTAMGAFNYAKSPISALYRSVASQPLEDVTGLPREYTEFAAELATPGLGLTKMPRIPGSPPEMPPMRAPISARAERARELSDEFGIKYSKGQAEGDLDRIKFEDMAARGAHGDDLQQPASKFFNEQYEDIQSGGRDVGRQLSRGELPLGSPVDAGASLNTTIADKAAEARAARDRLVDTADKEEAARRSAIDQSRINIGERIANGRPEIANTREAGDVAGQAVRDAAEANRTEFRGLYDQFGRMEGTFDLPAVTGMGQRAREELSGLDNPVVIDDHLTPAASRALRQLDEFSRPAIQNRAATAAPVEQGAELAGVNLRGIDRMRRHLVGWYKAAERGSEDQNAVRAVINSFDNQIERAITDGLFSGDEHALDVLQRARASYSRYQRTFRPQGSGDDVGTAMRRIVERGATPEETANMIIGSGKIGQAGLPVRIADRLEQVLGNDSGAWNAVRQAMWQKASQVMDKAGEIDHAKSAKSITDFANSTLGRRMFAPDELVAMRNHASGARDLERVIESLPARQAATKATEGFEQVFGGSDLTGSQRAVFQRMTQGTATPEETANAFFSVIASGNPGHAVRALDAIERIVGKGSPIMGSIRQGVWQKLTQHPFGKDQPGQQKLVQSINEFLNGNGGTLAKRLYTDEERKLMERYAEAVKNTIIPKYARTNSDTAPTMLGSRVARKSMAAIATAIGTLLHGGVTGALEGYGVGKLIDKGAAKLEGARKMRKLNESLSNDLPPTPKQKRLYISPAAKALPLAHATEGDEKHAQGGIVARRVRTQASRPRTTPIAKAPSPFQQRVPNPFTT